MGDKKIKLLFITCNFENYVERNTYYLSKELENTTELILWHEGGSLKEILEKINITPDFILLNDLKESRCPRIWDIPLVNIPVGIIVHDLHYKVHKRRLFMRENNIQYIFSIYRDAFNKTFPEFTSKMIWLPHFVNTDIFKDYNNEKDIDLLMMGKMAYYYPLRRRILREFKGREGFIYHEHPGYRNIEDNENDTDIFVGEKYAMEINRAKIFLTDNSKFQYPIIKYYEATACKSLLLAPSLNEIEDLGFHPGEHFVDINWGNFKEKAEYYLSHEKERNEIALEGYNMVHTKHSHKVRSKELSDEISKIIGHY